MTHTVEDAERRIRELEKLISAVRHDVNGALTPALMLADTLASNNDPQVKRAGEVIGQSVIRATKLLKSTRETVPSMRGAPQVPLSPAS